MSQKYIYSEKFYRSVDARASNTARLVFEILGKFFKIESVVDAGCGSGAWVRTAVEQGAHRAYGVDLTSSLNLIKANRDFDSMMKEGKVLLVERDFVKDVETLLPAADLAICLEVAEHLPKNTSQSLISLLTQSSDFVIFSAAQPGQGGTYHINERPIRFWVDEFYKYGFEPYDVFRDHLAKDRETPRFYALNMLLFVSKRLQKFDARVIDSISLGSLKIVDFDGLDKRNLLEKIRYSLLSLLPVRVVTFLSKKLKY